MRGHENSFLQALPQCGSLSAAKNIIKAFFFKFILLSPLAFKKYQVMRHLLYSYSLPVRFSFTEIC